jgi:hypothetical protein
MAFSQKTLKSIISLSLIFLYTNQVANCKSYEENFSETERKFKQRLNEYTIEQQRNRLEEIKQEQQDAALARYIAQKELEEELQHQAQAAQKKQLEKLKQEKQDAELAMLIAQLELTR